MNCSDCRDRLQQWLDGRTRDAATVSGEPPALCTACAEWSNAARRFDRGLRLLTLPAPPSHFMSRLLAQVATRRRARHRRLLFVMGVAATAAILLLAVGLSFHLGWPAPTPAPAPRPMVQAPQPEPPSLPTLGESMAEAGSAVASLTTRTADETVEKTKILLPVVVDPSMSKLDMPQLDPTSRSLRQTGESMSAGLEPVADSARRAVGLFLRELPPMDAPPKTGF